MTTQEKTFPAILADQTAIQAALADPEIANLAHQLGLNLDPAAVAKTLQNRGAELLQSVSSENLAELRAIQPASKAPEVKNHRVARALSLYNEVAAMN